MSEDTRPKVKDRVSLNAGGFTEDEPPEGWEDDLDSDITDVTVLARDLDESIWTVWDHGAKALRMVSFDENSNWAWVLPTPEVTDDQDS